ncbi:MAG TPA: gluconate 2-dehydrogenase subunit 3 family protein [Bacilli bacterium]
MTQESRYPGYDVLKEQTEWDDHTRSIVVGRTEPAPLKALTQEEVDTLRHLCPLFVDDYRAEVIDYVIRHVDETITSKTGESERKLNVPKAAELIRGGLQRIEEDALTLWHKRLAGLTVSERAEMIQKLLHNQGNASVWEQFPQAEWAQKILRLTVEAYCSHPIVWSEMGYGGPAYPRGYVRMEIGITDPWEAKKSQ